MTDCQKLKDEEAKKLTRDGNALDRNESCPPCEPKVCYGKINQCPLHTGKSNWVAEFEFPFKRPQRQLNSHDDFLRFIQPHTFAQTDLLLAVAHQVLGTFKADSAANAVKSNLNAKGIPCSKDDIHT